MVYSHLVYAIQVWGSADDTELENILTLQKKAVRMMTYKDQYPQIPGPLNPTDPLFHELEILKVHDVFKLQVSKLIFDCLSHNTPQNFWDWFTLNYTMHNYNTVSNTNINMNKKFEVESVSEEYKLHTQCSRLVNYGAKMLKVAGPLIWNSLPKHICNSQSVFTLKTNLKKYLIGQYESTLPQLSGYYYISKLSIDCMKLTVPKMHTFHIPPYLPAQLQSSIISKDGLKIKIFRK